MSYIVPIGPYHPSLEEPIHARLFTEGELIKDAEIFIGYNHRGIEKLGYLLTLSCDDLCDGLREYRRRKGVKEGSVHPRHHRGA